MTNNPNDDLTHFDDTGASRMVDVGSKPVTVRTAIAQGEITMQPETWSRINSGQISKGNVFEVARLAGIMAAKKTSDLIPLCHLLPLEAVKIEFVSQPPSTIVIRATVKTTAKTGVEMEALTAATVCALTIYDMTKAIDRGMTLGPFCLLEKTGGVRGDFLQSFDRNPPHDI